VFHRTVVPPAGVSATDRVLNDQQISVQDGVEAGQEIRRQQG